MFWYNSSDGNTEANPLQVRPPGTAHLASVLGTGVGLGESACSIAFLQNWLALSKVIL